MTKTEWISKHWMSQRKNSSTERHHCFASTSISKLWCWMCETLFLLVHFSVVVFSKIEQKVAKLSKVAANRNGEKHQIENVFFLLVDVTTKSAFGATHIRANRQRNSWNWTINVWLNGDSRQWLIPNHRWRRARTTKNEKKKKEKLKWKYEDDNVCGYEIRFPTDSIETERDRKRKKNKYVHVRTTYE